MSGVWVVKKCRLPFFFLSAHRISRKGRYFPRVIHEANAILTELAELRLSSKWTNRKLTSRKSSSLFTIFDNALFAPETRYKSNQTILIDLCNETLDKHFLHSSNGHGECLPTRSIVSKADRRTVDFYAFVQNPKKQKCIQYATKLHHIPVVKYSLRFLTSKTNL